MERVPLIGPDTPLPPGAAAVRARIVDSRGTLLRPFAVLLHRPELAADVADLGARLRFAGTLPAAQRELAILATGRAHGCGFEWDSHRDIAVNSGVRPEAVAALAADEDLSAFGADEAPLVGFARAFVRTSAVDDPTYAAAERLLGTPGVVELAVIVGYYSMLACVLNTCVSAADQRT